jgi:hypothetical protein
MNVTGFATAIPEFLDFITSKRFLLQVILNENQLNK